MKTSEKQRSEAWSALFGTLPAVRAATAVAGSQPYRCELPAFLEEVTERIILFDAHRVLSLRYLHHSLDRLLPPSSPLPDSFWLFVDPLGHHSLLSRAPHTLLPPEDPAQEPAEGRAEALSEEGLLGLRWECCNVLANQLQAGQLADISRMRVISIEQVRVRAQAGLYVQLSDYQTDVKRLLSWNQVYRAASARSFAHLSHVYEQVAAFLGSKEIQTKFELVKQADLARLTKYDTNYKVNLPNWPIIPTSFREYEEIDHYVPTPPHRVAHIAHRLHSLKQPVECPEDCVCIAEELGEDRWFCRFSLANGWETECPNRARKVECEHADKDKQRRCRNSEIKKQLRKKCVGKKTASEDQPEQIEEKLTWGIDLFTRNIIFHCLPLFDIQGFAQKVDNRARRSDFIQKTLAKAMNFLGEKGYSLVDTCQFIKAHADYAPDWPPHTQGVWCFHPADPPADPLALFTPRDYLYADILQRNYTCALDKQGFRIHTKGKGAICVDKAGIQQGEFIVQYFGQIYEPWRWYDRQDFIKEIMKKKKLRNYIPEFYNIYLEKHNDQPLGYDILVVDPSRKGNFSSRFSHSCDPNCGTIITVSQGKYFIGMYCFRDIEYGEELTFDYCSMTESNYEHVNSICLCGRERCRGNYLQLSNSKTFSNLMDHKNCFFTRNSTILKSEGQVTPRELELCADKNIKEGFLEGMPAWLVRWMAQVLAFIDEEGEVYRQFLIDSWRKAYPWERSEPEEQKQKKRQLYSDINRQDLINIRFQNLITSLDKLKFFFSNNEANQQPPIHLQAPPRTAHVLVERHDSVLNELQQQLIKYKTEAPARTIEHFFKHMRDIRETHLGDKLLLFRLCCLVVSHQLLFLGKTDFSHELLSDIVFFYAFTHTYFSPNEYASFEADQITVAVSEITGERGHSNERKERNRKKYPSSFVWGQMASWFKQTIVCPEASLSQDRRGTLSYPLIRSIMKSKYPYEKESRSAFLKTLLEKPASSWPTAIGCELSFKNPYKLYGTMLFESVHSRDQLSGHLPRETLLESCLDVMNSSLRVKLELFKKVELVLEDVPMDSVFYDVLVGLDLDLDSNVPLSVRNSRKDNKEPTKRVKRDASDPKK